MINVFLLSAQITSQSNSSVTQNDITITTRFVDVLMGRDGRDGTQGTAGEKGEEGATGPKGDIGDRGAPGPVGPEGEKGDTGPRGEMGEKGMLGPQGIRGPQGPRGTPAGGATYTRWGRKSCPSGREVVYTGIAGGSHYTHSGGGANYLCLPKDPQYSKNGVPSSSYLYGSEYENTLVGTHDHNVPCTVCYVATRATTLMIPAHTTCPTSWTKEYQGYLMAEYYKHARSAVYECVDEGAESVAGSAANTNGARFYHVVATCGHGLPCPPFVTTKTITCVVCTK